MYDKIAQINSIKAQYLMPFKCTDYVHYLIENGLEEFFTFEAGIYLLHLVFHPKDIRGISCAVG